MMWEDRFKATDGFLFGRAPARFLVENPWITKGASNALCVADGEGRNGVHLARQGLDVTSFDMAPTAVARAQNLAAEAGVRLTTSVSTWHDWDWSQSYDLTVAIFVQFTTPAERIKQFADLKSATRAGGRLVLHGYRPEQVKLGTGGPPDPAHMYTAEMLAEMFGDWHIARLASYEAEQKAGTGHVGRAALIDLIATRPA